MNELSKKLKKLLNETLHRKLAILLASFFTLYFMLILFGTYQLIKSPVKMKASFNPIKLLILTAKGNPLFLFCSLILAVGAGLLVRFYLLKEPRKDPRGIKLSKEKTEGSDQLMNRSEKEEAFNVLDYYHPSGIILGVEKKTGELLTVPYNGPKAPANGNVLVVGRSGSRKTSGVLLGNIYSCIQQGCSLVITDPKGEIYTETIAATKALGYNVKLFDIIGGQFQYSDGWDVLKVIRQADDPHSTADLVVNVITSNIGSKKEDFWNDANKNLLKAALLSVAIGIGYSPRGSTNNKAKGRTLDEVYRLISSEDMEQVIQNLINSNPVNRENLDACFRTWRDHSQKDSIKAGLATKLGIFQTKALTRILSEDEIDFRELADKKTIIYLLCSDKERTYQCILALFTAMLFKQVTDIADENKDKGLERPLYFFFEEFKNVGYIPDLSTKIATLRSRKINMIFCYQNIEQLMDTYSVMQDGRHEYATIIANCAVVLCCGAGEGDKATAEFFSFISGKMTIEEASHSMQTATLAPAFLKFNARENTRLTPKGRDVLLPSDITNIKNSEIFIKRDGFNATVETKYYYKCHPLYQYQVTDMYGNIIKQSHYSHIPLWRRNDLRLQSIQVSGKDIDISEEKIKITKISGYHKLQRLSEMEDRFNQESKFALPDFLYEKEPKEELRLSGKSYEYFSKDNKR